MSGTPARPALASSHGEWTVWLQSQLRELVLASPFNHLADYDGEPVFAAPLVGVADGDDPLFATFRQVVSARHLMPREVLGRQLAAGSVPRAVRVVAWAMPYTDRIRRSNRGADWPSELYSLARNNAGALSHAVHAALVERLSAAGWAAAAPSLDPGYDAFRCPAHGFASTWSERHVAFAAGLGRFGLNAGLITAAGMHVRLGSVVTDAPLDVTAGRRGDHRAPCLQSGGRVCDACAARCPHGAISAAGLDKERCHAMRRAVRERFLSDYLARLQLVRSPVVKNGTREPGYSLGCALCQCGVPCEAASPF